MSETINSHLQRSWYDHRWWTAALLPLAWLFYFLSLIRRFYLLQLRKPHKAEVPVVVVGNISVGGTGKTPLVIALANHLKHKGLSVGIISRGYGSQARHYPLVVTDQSPVEESGDEALLIAKATACPVVISPTRVDALNCLLQQHCDVVLSDDGLQHYQLARDYEIALIDGRRGLGNGQLLPAGPLREKASRLNSVDYVVLNGELKQTLNIVKPHCTMMLKADTWRQVLDDSEGALSDIAAFDSVHAVTGIGNPERFYHSLREMNVEFITHSFPDHHPFQLADIVFSDNLPVVMTAKDAVKCCALLKQSELSVAECQRYWYVPVSAQLPAAFFQQLIDHLSLSPVIERIG